MDSTQHLKELLEAKATAIEKVADIRVECLKDTIMVKIKSMDTDRQLLRAEWAKSHDDLTKEIDKKYDEITKKHDALAQRVYVASGAAMLLAFLGNFFIDLFRHGGK